VANIKETAMHIARAILAQAPRQPKN